MTFQKEYLDLMLVPAALLIMLVYNLFFLYRYLYHPHTTVCGFDNNDKRAWVERIMQANFSPSRSLFNFSANFLSRSGTQIQLSAGTLPPADNHQADRRDVPAALTVISSNASAATFLASVCLTLSSLIGAWLGNSSDNFFQSVLIYGDTRPFTLSIKYICLLSCFLLAFSFFVQSTRHFIHANYLISTPDTDIPLQIVEKAVIMGGDFWSLGLRALYFALILLLWFFGPIPMFVSSIVLVTILHYFDSNCTPLHEYGTKKKSQTNSADSFHSA